MKLLGRPLAHGRTSDVFAYGRDTVVKVPRPGVPAHWAELEARLTHAVHLEGLPTPAVHDVVQIDGRDSVVFERIHGPSMWQLMMAEPETATALARQLADIHHDIHCVAAPASLPKLSVRVCEKLESADALSGDERAEACEIAQSLPEGAWLCHGDMHPGNVLMGAAGPIVIDWFDASTGDPLGDIVRTSLLLRSPDEEPVSRPHLPGATADVLIDLHLEYLRSMLATNQVDQRTLRDWEAVLAASRIAEGAQSDDTELVALWRSRRGGPGDGTTTPLTAALAALGIVEDDRP